jgi:hypothetical protein
MSSRLPHHGLPALGLALALALAGCEGRAATRQETATPGGSSADRALRLLEREVPAWPAENDCFSCHHNGDAARALFTARRLGRDIAPAAIEGTLAWLAAPQAWEHQKGDPAFADATLAHLQFAAALAAAQEAGLIARRAAARAAGDIAARLQGADGSWTIEPAGTIGSPVTWGTHLATALTRRTLETLDADRFGESIGRAREWLLAAPCRNVVEAAALLLGLGGDEAPGAGVRREACLRELEAARSTTGAWGPHRDTPPEAFDTALVLIALASVPSTPTIAAWIRDGRDYLLAAQEEDGGWPATTRPRGGVSYAQSTSTSAWAALALLLTADA